MHAMLHETRSLVGDGVGKLNAITTVHDRNRQSLRFSMFKSYKHAENSGGMHADTTYRLKTRHQRSNAGRPAPFSIGKQAHPSFKLPCKKRLQHTTMNRPRTYQKSQRDRNTPAANGMCGCLDVLRTAGWFDPPPYAEALQANHYLNN